MNIIFIIGIIGFFICLFIMYRTKHGIPGIRKYDTDFRLLDMQFRYDNEIVYTTFTRIGQEGRKAYKNFLLVDFIFIACFFVVMTAISLNLTNNITTRFVLISLAALRALFDITENTLLIILINTYPQRKKLMADLCSWSTTLKFISLFLWIFGIILSMLIQNI